MINTMNFPDYLLSIGYQSYKCIKNELIPWSFNHQYSTVIENGLSYCFKKDNIEICWGLHEKDQGPTLIYPRPNIWYKTSYKILETKSIFKTYQNCSFDDPEKTGEHYKLADRDFEIDRILKKYSNEEILALIISQEKIKLEEL